MPFPLHFRRHRFFCEAITPVYFPPYKADNILRGMAGLLLPRAAPEAAESILNPKWPNAPSGFATPPKPFQFRAHLLDGRRFQPKERFHFDVHQFAPEILLREALEAACRLLATEGLGPGRGKLNLLTTETIEVIQDLTPAVEATRIQLNFLAPAAIDPLFNALIARLHERINALSVCYGGNPPLGPLQNIDVQITRDNTEQIARQRHSTRTGQTYETGGIAGRIEYEGPLTEALPYLLTGEWTGVAGGYYEIEPPK